MRCKYLLSLLVGLLLVPAFVAADPPSQSGIVLRGEVLWGVVFFDDSGTKLVVYGVDPVAFCNGVGIFDEWSYQSNLLPTDDVVKDLTKGDDVQTSVWPFGFFDCFLFQNVPPLATGTSDAVSTDNNLFGEDTKRANSWNFSAHGVLHDTVGEDYIFQHNTHCTWKDYSDFSTARCHNKIRLR